jgi:hypothetical protein
VAWGIFLNRGQPSLKMGVNTVDKDVGTQFVDSSWTIRGQFAGNLQTIPVHPPDNFPTMPY